MFKLHEGYSFDILRCNEAQIGFAQQRIRIIKNKAHTPYSFPSLMINEGHLQLGHLADVGFTRCFILNHDLSCSQRLRKHLS